MPKDTADGPTSDEPPSTTAPDDADEAADLFDDAAETFAILGSPVRLQLAWLLSQGRRDVSSLADEIGASKALTSQHLAKMRAAGLVSARRKGKRQIYLLDDPHVIALVEQVLDHHRDLRSRDAGAPPSPTLPS